MFSKAILMSAFASIVYAQSLVLTFTHVPNPVTDGSPTALTWATNDTSSPVTILLRKGPSSNLQTVQTLTTEGSQGQFIWTPCTSLPNDSDYALEILQAGQVNYYGPFQIQGYTGQGTCSGLVTSSTSSGASSMATSNSTAAMTVSNSGNSTSAATMTSAASSTGTGSITSQSSSIMSTTTMSTSTSASKTATTNGAGFQSSATSAPTSTGAASALMAGGSSLTFLFGAVAAFAMA